MKEIKISVFVVYDSVENSVFAGQVVQLIQKKIKQNRQVLLISFEKNPHIDHHKTIPNLANLKKIIFRKIPFLGKTSLISAIYKVKNIIKPFTQYEIIARGPHAAWICANAIDFKKCRRFIVQARGLIAEEYRYTHGKEKNIIKKLIHHLRYKQYKNLEETVYRKIHVLPNAIIEAVSPALKQFVIQNFGVAKDNVTIATEDIPERIIPSKIAMWRLEIRKKLNIPKQSIVYCYNGSIKPWQCPQKTILFFKERYAKNKNSFLLILTQNKDQFEALIKQNNIKETSYLVKRIDYTAIYAYLSACDYGIIFREKDIINWVSRPTKVLEYRSVGLEIIHNNTIDWIIQN